MAIPIRNLYYLLAYAWDRLDEAGLVSIGDDDFAGLADLLATVLVGGVARLVRRGLDRGYVERVEPVAGVRGKLLFAESIRGNLLAHGRSVCAVEDLTVDVLHNRLIAQTIRDLLRVDRLDGRLMGPLRDALRRLEPMSPIDVRPSDFGRVQLRGNSGFYRFLLDVCRLFHESVAVDETTGRRTFRDFRRDRRKMADLFERFAFNFYRRHAAGYAVANPTLQWAGVDGPPESAALLPRMRTDVVLSRPGRRIVIDTKYYAKTLAQYRGGDRIWSGHLYQLYAYLRNMDLADGPATPSEGVLLYPRVDRSLDVDLMLQGHRVRVRTIDLGRSWRAIAGELAGLLD